MAEEWRHLLREGMNYCEEGVKRLLREGANHYEEG